MFDNTTNQPSKFQRKKLFEVNDDARRDYNTNSQTSCKTTMRKSYLCDYSNAHILVKRTITITEVGTDAAARQAKKIIK